MQNEYLKHRPLGRLLLIGLLAVALPDCALAQSAGYDWYRNDKTTSLTPSTQPSAQTRSSQAANVLVPVFLNAREIAHVFVKIDDHDRITHVKADRLKPWVQAHLSDEAQRIFQALTAADGMLALDAAPQAGFSMAYDENAVALNIAPAPASLRKQSLSIQEQAITLSNPPLERANISGFINARAGQDYLHETVRAEGRQAFRLDLDGAVNMKGWVVEGRGDYLENDTRPWRRGDMRLVHDLPDKMIRLAAGDLSYPVTAFQSYQPIMGISVARNFSLQPYRVTEPAGQTSFVLQSPSRVDILVNGQRIRTLQLDAGPYDISDFPVADGSNDVTLLITDATGRTEEKNFSLLSDQKLLRQGLHEYAYNIGIKSAPADRKIKYDTDSPVFSAFHRLGVTEALTAGASLQGDSKTQQFGLSAVTATAIGTIGWESALSHDENTGADAASRVSYSYQDIAGAKTFFLSAEYKGDDFTALGQDRPNNPARWELASGYYQTVFANIQTGIGGRYRFARDGNDDDWSYSANARKALTPELSLNLNGQHRRNEGAGVFISLTWIPQASNHTFTASTDTLAHTQSTRWDWRDGKKWQAGMGVTKEHDDIRGTGNASYRGQRLEAGIYHDINRFQTPSLYENQKESRTEQRTQIRTGAAIAFADGHMALSRPIDNSFVLLTNHENLQDYAIGINPQRVSNEKVEYESRIDWAGAAVIPDMIPYFYRPVRIDTRNLPAGYDIGDDNFVSLPSYKSGTLIKIGSAANVYADGYILQPDHQPVALSAGIIRARNDRNSPDQEFFTNRNGRFRISQLSPGVYELRLHAWPDQPVTMEIPADFSFGRYDAGTLILSGETR